MISVEEAQAILERATKPLGVETVELSQALGRVLAESVTADRDFPPTDRSAMDGFAVCSDDLTTPGIRLPVRNEARAGASPPDLGRGEAMPIFTGAVVPRGADAVVMIEDTVPDREAGTVLFRAAVRPGQHVRPRGSEFHAGAPLLESGVPIRAAEIAALASVGRIRPCVHRVPRVHVLSTGDEVVEAGETPAPWQVRNSNAPALLAQLAEIGFSGRYLGIAGDERSRLDALVREGIAGDVLLVTGGVSVGEYDLVGAALAAAGAETLFHKVAVKPGKPILAARAGGCSIFGLPGNPVSAFLGFVLFVEPALRRLAGAREWRHPRVTARLEQPVRKRPGRPTWHLAALRFDEGRFLARETAAVGSGDVLALTRANGWVFTASDVEETPAGAEVPALLWPDRLGTR